MARRDCPCGDNPLCAGQEGERTCSLCGFDFKAQHLSREDLAAARALGAQRGWRTALTRVQEEVGALRSRLSEAESRQAAIPPAAVASNDNQDFQIFRDFPEGPEMVVLPAGQFMMGSPEGDGYENEYPQHPVHIGYRFAIGKYPLTFGEWDVYASETGGYKPGDQGWGRGKRPVTNISWQDAQAYIHWISQKTGKNYRLLSESEWEYAARAGTNTTYFTGETISTEQANFHGRVEGVCRGRTTEVDHFSANPWGVHDMLGNVLEWVHDGHMHGYAAAPADGSAREAATDVRVLRGGSWSYFMTGIRAALRVGYFTRERRGLVGFRVARTLA